MDYGSKQARSQQPQQQDQLMIQLRNISFDVSEIYFPLFILQLRYDVFALRNRAGARGNAYQSYNQQQQSTSLALARQLDSQFELIEEGDDEALYREY
jgi:hypothetical protein